jgi:uncharacterized protein YbjT (DUF2867 family)
MRILSVLAAAVGLFVMAGPGAVQAQEGPAVVLVAGGTGGTGRHVVTQLLEQGHTVRVLSRSEESARGAFGDAVEVVVGDVRTPETLAAAVAGVRYVVSAIGSSGRTDPSNSPEAVDYRGVKNLVEAAVVDGGVEHFVLVSSMGISQPTHPLNRFANNILLWKGLGENALRFSGLNYTIVRPGGLIDEPGGQAAIRAGQGDTMEQGRIPRADVAKVCVAALGRADASRKTLEIISGAPGQAVDWEAFFAPLAQDPQGGFGG